jgi:hypothetical protein
MDCLNNVYIMNLEDYKNLTPQERIHLDEKEKTDRRVCFFGNTKK